jgi:hypothetical protein
MAVHGASGKSFAEVAQEAEHTHRVAWRQSLRSVEAMEWAEIDGADYIFGLGGNTALDALVAETADNFCASIMPRAANTKLRTYASFTYQANSWDRPRKVVARLECSLQSDGGEGTATGMRRHPPCHHLTRWHGQVSLRGRLLPARADGEPHQLAIRPHVMSQRDRQSGAARSPHRRLLADVAYAPRSRRRAHWPRLSSRRSGSASSRSARA